MEQTLKPVICSFKFFQLLVLLGLLYFCSGSTHVTKTVKDIATLSCGYNISTDELRKVRIYWQKHNEMVLSVVSGKVEVWPNYKNRTFPVFSNSLSIVILALRLSDNGEYTCVVQKNKTGSYKREHLSSVKLSVTADFPVPTITDLGNPSTNTKRLRCSTSGGSPKPLLSWFENGKELNVSNTSIIQDPETELYAVSSEMDFNVKNNHSFMCVVKYGDSMVPKIFNWQGLVPPTSSPNLYWYLHTLVILAVILTAMGLYKYLRNRHAARQRNRRRNGESMEMEVMSPINTGSAEASN